MQTEHYLGHLKGNPISMPTTCVTPVFHVEMPYRAATAQKIRAVVDNFNFVIEVGDAHVESFLNTFQEISIVTDDSLTVHGDLERSKSILTADTISECICHYKGVRSGDNVTRLDGGAAGGVVAADELSGDQSTSVVAERPACFLGKVIMDDFDDNLDS
jgi:hypothetical protein